MTVLTVNEIKLHLNIVGDDDDALLGDYIAAAEEWVGDYIGKPLASYATDDPPAPVPEKAKQAVRLLCAHYYENREAALTSMTGASALEMPLGVADLLRPLRSWGAS